MHTNTGLYDMIGLYIVLYIMAFQFFPGNLVLLGSIQTEIAIYLFPSLMELLGVEDLTFSDIKAWLHTVFWPLLHFMVQPLCNVLSQMATLLTDSELFS